MSARTDPFTKERPFVMLFKFIREEDGYPSAYPPTRGDSAAASAKTLVLHSRSGLCQQKEDLLCDGELCPGSCMLDPWLELWFNNKAEPS